MSHLIFWIVWGFSVPMESAAVVGTGWTQGGCLDVWGFGSGVGLSETEFSW